MGLMTWGIVLVSPFQCNFENIINFHYLGPLVTIWHIYKTPINYSTDQPVHGILMWGGLGIALGLICYGERVIMTMGSKISKVTPSLGFTVVMISSIVVVVCSVAGYHL